MSQIISPRAPRTTPRASFNLRALVSCLVALILSQSLLTAHAQTTRPKPRAAQPSADKNNETKEREAAARRRRVQALDALQDTASRARSIPELDQRALILAAVADALWTHDERQARINFERAWDAATDYERSAHKENGAASQPASETDDAETVVPQTELREAILLRIARRDTRLADKFHQTLLEEVAGFESDGDIDTASYDRSIHSATYDALRRLALARQLLSEKETAPRAAEIARAVVIQNGISFELIQFLNCLRALDQPRADQLFTLLLSRMNASLTTQSPDANAVLLLAAYALNSNNTLAIVEGSLAGNNLSCNSQTNNAEVIAQPRLLQNFYALTASALTRRPVMNPTSSGQEVRQELSARYFALEFLLRYFVRDAASYVAALQAERATLMNEIAESGRNRLAELSRQEFRTRTVAQGTDPLGEQLENINKATTEYERDYSRARAVEVAARRKLWQRAQSLVEAISDLDLRTKSSKFIRTYQVMFVADAYSPTQTDDYERASKFVSGVIADVPSQIIARGFAQAAQMAAKRADKIRAEELLREASRSALRVEDERARASALAMVAMYAARINSTRTWELLAQAINRVNAESEFSGDDGAFRVTIDDSITKERNTPLHDPPSVLAVEWFGLAEMFTAAAQYNFARALEQANSITRPLPRAYAVVATARVGLEAGK